MDELFQKYKVRIESLPISQEDKEKLYNNFYNEIQFKLVNSFFDTLTTEQKRSIAEASTDEEAIRIYFQLLNESIELPEFLQFIEQVYTEAMTKALSELPNLENPTAIQTG